MFTGLLATLRPHQWVKNLFVLAPLLFAQELFDARAALRGVLAFFIFCFLAGAVYTLNDLVDLERDRAHPRKKNRPIASGRVPAAVAASMAAAFTAGSLVAAALLSTGFVVVLAAYLLVNLAYSFKLKHWPYIDVLCLALGFLLRIVAGSQAIGVTPSVWLLLCTFLLSLFLALGKRKQEMAAVGAAFPRPVLAHYHPAVVSWGMRATAVLTLLAYAAYTLDPRTRGHFHTTLLPLGIPFAAFGIYRFLVLVERCSRTGESPTEHMLKDIPFVLSFALWVGLNITLIY